MRADSKKRLTIFTEAEKLALYGLPDFDEFQRAEFFAFTEAERALADRRQGPVERLHCLLQIGYFKAKKAFFDISAQTVPAEDVAFLLDRYFPRMPEGTATLRTLRRRERYAQRAEIAKLFGYRLWSGTDRPALVDTAARLARRDVTPTFIVLEVLAFLNARKIVRPGHTTLQSIIAHALTAERRRLEQLIESSLDADTTIALQSLLVREETLSELAALKQDARNFGHQMMTAERHKRATLAPLYRAATALLPGLGISQQNIEYYADLALFYTIYDLRRMRPGQTHLYLLCYAWQRYRQLSDNLVEAFDHHLRQRRPRRQHMSRPKPSGSRKRPEWGGCCCSMSTRRSTTRRRSVRSETKPSRSCPGRRCSPPASACARSPSASWNCVGRRSTGWRPASRGTCGRS
jgi:uncharacterized protein DUF4158